MTASVGLGQKIFYSTRMPMSGIKAINGTTIRIIHAFKFTKIIKNSPFISG